MIEVHENTNGHDVRPIPSATSSTVARTAGAALSVTEMR